MNYWEVGLFFIFFFLIFGNYGMFTSTVLKWSKKPRKGKKGKLTTPKLTTGETVSCFVPFLQVYIVRKALYRKAPVVGTFIGIAALLIIVRLINALLLPINSYVMLYTAIGVWIGLFLTLLIYGFVTADCTKMYGFGWLCIILSFLFPFVVCWYPKNIIPKKMFDMYKEDTFSEHKSDTVIKQRRNK